LQINRGFGIGQSVLHRAGGREGKEGTRGFVVLLMAFGAGAPTGQRLEDAALRIELMLFAMP